MRQFFFTLMLCFPLVSVNCQPDVMREQHGKLTAASKEAQESKQGHEMNLSATGTWVKVLTSPDPFSSISFGDEQHGIITGEDERFWLTSDAGNTWNKHTIRGKEIAAQGGAYSLVKSRMTSSGNVHALGHLEEVGSAIFSSFDTGKTWKIINYSDGSLNGIDVVEDQSWIVGTINTVAVVLHAKGQEAWKEIWRGSKRQYLTSVDFINANTGWSVGAKGLILHTTDGGRTWHTQQALSEENLESVAFADTKTGFVVGQKGIIFYTADGGNTWSKQESGTQANLTNIVAVNPSEVWVVGQNGTVLFTNDAGHCWQPQGIGTQADIYALTIKSGEVWIATSEGKLLHSTKKR